MYILHKSNENFNEVKYIHFSIHFVTVSSALFRIASWHKIISF